jgi:tetraacyldisaccharide 4'-kinase
LVIVVGNVVAGGSGKTPVVIALVRHLQDRGLRVGVVSRGYGRTATDCLEVRADSTADEVGDEPALIHQLTQTPVVVAASRVEAAVQLLTLHPATQVIVCDDGLQHLALYRDLEICVFDDRGVGNGWQLPAGPLREAWPRAVDLVLHTGLKPAFAGFTAQRALAPYALRSDGTRVSLADLAAKSGKPLFALAAIAKPEAFFEMLREQGLTLEKTLALPDHYDFNSWSRNTDGVYTLICTEKDAVKLWRHAPQALAVPLLFTPEPAFLTRIDALLSSLMSTPSSPTLSSPHGHTTT